MRPRFAADLGFHKELKRRVYLCVGQRNVSLRESRGLHVKTVVMLCWFCISYGLLVFVAANAWQALVCSLSLAFAIAGIGFNIQHDANHGAYSNTRILNRALGFSLDLLGASSYVWHHKHNTLHHTYTNLSRWDDDIDLGVFGRLSPAQRRRPIYRAQQYYLWLVYGFLGPKWHFVDDFVNIIQGRIGCSRFRRPKGWELVGLVGGKLVFVTLAFLVPLLRHPFWTIGAFYAITWFIAGGIVSVIFQLAHCVEGPSFPILTTALPRIQNSWAVHQVPFHCQLRTAEQTIDLVSWRAQSPNRAPPVPFAVARSLLEGFLRGAGCLRRIWSALFRARQFTSCDCVALSMASPHGKGQSELGGPVVAGPVTCNWWLASVS